jgi:hypothetical protein
MNLEKGWNFYSGQTGVREIWCSWVERMLSVFVRVNRPCYLLFLQTLSDGTVVIPDLIYQNYYLDVSRGGRLCSFPIFHSPASFGSEILEVFFSDRPFLRCRSGIVSSRTRGISRLRGTSRIQGERDRCREGSVVQQRINLKTVKGNS